MLQRLLGKNEIRTAPSCTIGAAEESSLLEFIRSISRRNPEIAEKLQTYDVEYLPIEGFTKAHFSKLVSDQSPAKTNLADTGRQSAATEKLLVLDCAEEGPIPSRMYLEAIAYLGAKYSIKVENIVLFSQNLATLSELERLFPKNSSLFASSLNWSFANDFLWNAPEIYKATKRPDRLASFRNANTDLRKFLCLNFAPRQHRLALFALFHSSGYLDNSFFSFRIDGKPEAIKSSVDRLFEVTTSRFPEFADELANLQKQPDLNRYLDFGENAGVADLMYTYPVDAARSSFWTIVTETGMQGGLAERVTEKTVKPIVSGRPFIIFGEPNTLRFLRSMGFTTFSDFVDESYDGITDPGERMSELIRVVRSLWTREFTSSEIGAIDEICAHNRKVLFHELRPRMLALGSRTLGEALGRMNAVA